MIDEGLLEFLRQLKQNNNKPWFNERKAQYKEMREHFTEGLRDIAFDIARFDPEIARRLDDPTTVKVFRIYRDTRFSKNADPLKTNINGFISAGPERPAYYLSIVPGGSVAGGGLYMPPSKVLKAIREEVEETHTQLRSVIEADEFRSVYPAGLDQSGALKTAPRGYSVEHPAIDLLRLKSFAALHSFRDKEVVEPAFKEKLIGIFEVQYQLNVYLDKALRRLDAPLR